MSRAMPVGMAASLSAPALSPGARASAGLVGGGAASRW